MSDTRNNPVIRTARPEDAAGCLDIYAPIVLETPVSFETTVPGIEDFARRIETILVDYPWLVAETEGIIAGYAYACRHRERDAYRFSTEVSVYVAAPFFRTGIGRRLYLGLFEILRRQGYCNAFAGIALPNPPSVGFHESLGFVPVGVYEKTGYKFDRWFDVGWWALRLMEDIKVDEPVPFLELGIR